MAGLESTGRKQGFPWRLAPLAALALLICVGFLPAAAASFAAVGHNTSHHSDDGSVWTRPTQPITGYFENVAYGNGVWVAVGSSCTTCVGTIARSTDGISWTTTAPTVPNPTAPTLNWPLYTASYHDVTFGNGLFVVVGAYSLNTETQIVLTSPDGLAWDIWPAGQYWLLMLQFGVAYGDGLFVSVGAVGNMMVSADGQAWIAHDSGQINALYGIAYNGVDRWVAVGAGGTILTSLTGLDWLPATSGVTAILYGVTYGNGLWVAVGASGTLLTSPDGENWTPRATGMTNSPTLYNVAYGAGRYVAVGSTSPNATTYSSALITSTDGINWQTRPVSADYSYGPRGITYGGGQWVGAGENAMVRSLDGLDWISANPWVGYYQLATAYNGTHWVSVGYYGSVFTSPDGKNWTARHSGGTTAVRYFYGLTWGAGLWVAVGSSTPNTLTCSGTSAFIITSPDGITWTQRASGGSGLCGVAYGPGKFVAVGISGTVRTSVDGITWATGSSGTTSNLMDVAYGAGNYTAVGAAGTIRASPDGVTWTSRSVSPATAAELRGIAYDGSASPNKWVAVGNGVTASSTNGVAWNLATTTGSFYEVAYESGTWAAVGDRTISSPDGAGWSVTNSDTGLQRGVASQAVPPLECRTWVSPVYINAPATFGAAGGTWPYTWTAPGSNNEGPVAGGGSVTRTYADPGTYTVTLTDAAATSQTCQVTVVPPPLVCGPASLAVEVGQAALLSASGGTPDYTWSAPGSTPAASTGSTFTANYSSPGTFTITVTDAWSPAQTATCSITVTALPVEDDEEEEDEGDGGEDDDGSGGSGGSGGADPVTPAPQPPTYHQVTPSPAATGGTSPGGQAPPSGGGTPAPGHASSPGPVAHAGTDQKVLSGQLVVLNGTLSQMTGTPQYQWRQVHGTPVILRAEVTATPSFVAPATAGSLVFELEIVDAAGRTDTALVTIHVQPALVILPAPQGGFTVAFASNRPGLTHLWEFGDGQTGQGAQVMHTYAEAGTYKVRLTATSADGLELASEEEVLLQAPSQVAARAPVAPVAQAEAGISPLVPVALLAAVALAVLTGLGLALARRRKPAKA